MKNRAIFRESAIQRYIQRRDKDVLPRLVRPRFFLFLWILLVLVLLAGILIWSIRIPVYTAAPGVLRPDETTGQLQVLLFVSADQQSFVHVGQTVQLQIGASGPQLHLTITSVTSQVLSPAQIRATYALNNPLGLVVSQPAVVALVTIQAGSSLQGYAGSLVSAEIQVSTRSALSLVPGLNHFVGA